MEESNNKKFTIIVYKKGYLVNEKGEVCYKNKKRKLVYDTNGYLTFTSRFNYLGKSVCRRIYVHKLQAYHKFGEKSFDDLICVRHLDNCKNNNQYKNIGLGNQSENMMDIPKELRCSYAIHASKSIRRFSDDEVKSIREDRGAGMSYSKLCNKYNTSKGTLSYLFNKSLY